MLKFVIVFSFLMIGCTRKTVGKHIECKDKEGVLIYDSSKEGSVVYTPKSDHVDGKCEFVE